MDNRDDRSRWGTISEASISQQERPLAAGLDWWPIRRRTRRERPIDGLGRQPTVLPIDALVPSTRRLRRRDPDLLLRHQHTNTRAAQSAACVTFASNLLLHFLHLSLDPLAPPWPPYLGKGGAWSSSAGRPIKVQVGNSHAEVFLAAVGLSGC